MYLRGRLSGGTCSGEHPSFQTLAALRCIWQITQVNSTFWLIEAAQWFLQELCTDFFYFFCNFFPFQSCNFIFPFDLKQHFLLWKNCQHQKQTGQRHSMSTDNQQFQRLTTKSAQEWVVSGSGGGNPQISRKQPVRKTRLYWLREPRHRGSPRWWVTGELQKTTGTRNYVITCHTTDHVILFHAGFVRLLLYAVYPVMDNRLFVSQPLGQLPGSFPILRWSSHVHRFTIHHNLWVLSKVTERHTHTHQHI